LRRPLVEPVAQPSPPAQDQQNEVASETPESAPTELAPPPPERPDEHAAAAESQAADEPKPEAGSERTAPQVVEVWWPKDTGPFRRQHRHRPDKRESAQKAPPLPQKQAEQRRPPKRPSRQTRAEGPAVNPDSPFAVLGSLRSQLADKKNA
jgi:hypothetical protein